MAGLTRSYVHGASDVQEFMERTSHVLSLISHGVGVTMSSGGPKNALGQVTDSTAACGTGDASASSASSAVSSPIGSAGRPIAVVSQVMIGYRPGPPPSVATTSTAGTTNKALVARTLARAVDCSFSRLQFTPDLVPSDIIGTRIYNQREGEFQVSFGPVFTNLLLAALGLVTGSLAGCRIFQKP